MTDEEQGQFYDVVYEMRGFAATLLAASRGDSGHFYPLMYIHSI